MVDLKEVDGVNRMQWWNPVNVVINVRVSFKTGIPLASGTVIMVTNRAWINFMFSSDGSFYFVNNENVFEAFPHPMYVSNLFIYYFKIDYE
jgi:hypothetical protein